MATEYYLIINEAQKGPFAFEELTAQGIGPDMLVWRAGLPDWTRASELPELFELIGPQRPYYGQNPQYGPQQPPNYGQNPQYGGPQQPYYGQNPQYGAPQQPNYSQNPQYGGPQQPNYGQNPQYGGPQQPNYSQNPQYGPQPNYGDQPNYNRNYNNYPPSTKNWQTWAIVATVIGFFFSCIGGIIGAIGIWKANQAINYYRSGQDQLGNQANSTAKTMTIIALILGGIGLLGTIFLWNGNVSSIYSFPGL